MFVFLATSVSFAGVVQDCYSDAESNNSGLSVTVKLGTTTVLTSSDLDAIFDKIAEKHAASNLDLSYNAAGESAMEEAMDCIFDAELGTLSAIVTNQRFADLRVRTNTSTIINESPEGHMRFNTFDPSNCEGAPALIFTENSGPRAITFAGVAVGSNDVKIDFTPADTCVESGQCSGNCLGECTESGNECYCSDPSGSCDEPFPGASISFDGNNVFKIDF